MPARLCRPTRQRSRLCTVRDESPTFAPNGQMIMFAIEDGGRGTLGAVSIDGSVTQRLSLTSGSVREPSWSPFSQ